MTVPLIAHSREEHEARIRIAGAAMNEALAAAYAAGLRPWITVMVGDKEPRPYTYVSAVAVREREGM